MTEVFGYILTLILRFLVGGVALTATISALRGEACPQRRDKRQAVRLPEKWSNQGGVKDRYRHAG